MKSHWKGYVLLFTALLLWTAAMMLLLETRSRVSILKEDTCEQSDFREQYVPPRLYEEMTEQTKTGGDFGDILTATMLSGKFYPKEVSLEKDLFLKYKPQEYALLKSCYQAVWADIRCFPIPDRTISYEDTFGEPRAYGGQRTHEGTDLFGKRKEPGYYPVLSMTDGVVENIGWLPLGGYRIGIRSLSGGYFYYAHLSEYEKEFQRGDEVRAGEILGFMGDTGYGPEGTHGRFPVHLHLGIYIKTPRHEELSVNPYWVLRAISKKFRNYSY